MLVLRIMMSEVEEVATDTNSQPPAKKMKVELSSSSENEFLVDKSATSAVQNELDSYLTCTDSGHTCSAFGMSCQHQ